MVANVDIAPLDDSGWMRVVHPGRTYSDALIFIDLELMKLSQADILSLFWNAGLIKHRDKKT
jgi:hypothetical protein